MHFKPKILVSLVIISFLSFTFSSSNLAQVAEDDYEFYYSDFLVPGEILEWNVVTFVKEADFNWELTSGHFVEEGDVITFLIITDPDALNLSDPEDLQYNTQAWVETHLNDIDLSSAEEWNYFVEPFDEMGYNGSGYVGPERHGSPTHPQDTENYWKSLHDEMEPDCFNNESGILEVSLTADLFTLKLESYESGENPSAEPFESVKSVEISYNIEWGYLDRMRVYEYYEHGAIGEEEQEVLELVLENSRRTQETPIEWVSGLIALSILGMIAVYKRKIVSK